VGFVSGDLWEHTVGYLVAPLLENLDRRECAVICYYDNARNDKNTARIRATTEQWRNICGVSEQRVAEQIRSDRVDVLFDLAGHTALNRLRVFARKPAPIQITWAGYVGTTGLEAMDYLLADRYEVPEGEESHYREAILRMPDDYICYGPPAYAPPVGPLPAVARGQVTFGSFNNPAKLNPEVVALWSRVLARVPGSRLMLKYRGCDNLPVQDHFRRLFAGQGIGPERLEFAPPAQHRGVFEAYNEVDIGLDPFPYSGGLTTCEALWMGVPVITCPGSTFASRHSLTHATNAGLGQFVARDFEHYVDLAAAWAGDLEGLAALRAGMRAQVSASPLCDARRFAGNFQRLLRDVWRRWARQ
jgi:predicted O-linked N-acetylglucosamine transferase (SPINDLY family)